MSWLMKRKHCFANWIWTMNRPDRNTPKWVKELWSKNQERIREIHEELRDLEKQIATEPLSIPAQLSQERQEALAELVWLKTRREQLKIAL